MSEHSATESSSAPVRDSDVIALLKKLQQQMVFLEKKLDLLISQQAASAAQPSAQPTGERSFERPRPSFDRGDRGTSSFKDKHFSKPPFRSYGPSQGGGGYRGDRDRGPSRDRGDRPTGPSQGFSDRPSYGRPRRDDRNGAPSGDRPGGFSGPRKPFYKGRKDRG